MTVPLSHLLAVAALLFALGLAGVLVRRNLLFVLVSVEVMLNAAGLAFVAAGARHWQVDGQVAFLFVLVVAAAEVSVGLALLLGARRQLGTIDVDHARRLGG